MLQDPVKSVLVPLAPDEARQLSSAAVEFLPVVQIGAAGWGGLPDITARCGAAELSLGDVLASLDQPPTATKNAYECAFAAMVGGDRAAAAAGFATSALTGGPAAASLYGLALALLELGQHEPAERIAAFVSELPDYADPRAAALAGYAAFLRRQPKAARVHLAKAARLARLQPDFRAIQRFAQRVLLMQQFALGD